MDINMILTVVFICVGIALIVFLIEFVRTVRSARTTIDNVQKQLEPTLAHVEQITNEIKPAIAKVDPLMDRVSLTIDAANLEMMRVDQILEDVTAITDTASNAVEAVDNVANAPLELMNNVSSKVRKVLKSKAASDEAQMLEQQRVAAAKALDELRAAEKETGLTGTTSAQTEGAAPAVEAPATEATDAKAAGENAYFTYEAASSK